MGKENKILKYRKQMLCELPQRLNDDFAISLGTLLTPYRLVINSLAGVLLIFYRYDGMGR